MRMAWFVASVLVPGSAAAQHQPPDTLMAIVALDRSLVAVARELEAAVWPGYRFGELTLMYLVPDHGRLLVGWPGEPPAGMRALAGQPRTYWAGTHEVAWPSGAPMAYVNVVASYARPEVVGLTLHEAFHAFQATQRREGRHFGRGENAMLTARYPVFDTGNEAAFAVESRLLRRAADAREVDEARRLASEFVALRRQRQAALDPAMAGYEKAAELNEGLAQYAMLRGLEVLGRRSAELRAEARDTRHQEARVLDSTLAAGSRSVRRRFYATGSYLSLLLDRIVAREWKRRVHENDEWLQDILASAVAEVPVPAAIRTEVQAALADASRAVATLRQQRIEQRDSILAGGSFELALDPAGSGQRRFDLCGFDPQNLLTTGTGQTLHLRMLQVCRAGETIATLQQAAVEDDLTGTIRTVLDPSTLRISIGGRNVAVPAAGVVLQGEEVTVTTGRIHIVLPRAVLVGGERRLLIIPLTIPSRESGFDLDADRMLSLRYGNAAAIDQPKLSRGMVRGTLPDHRDMAPHGRR